MYLEFAKRWATVLEAHHRDPESGGYYTAADDTDDVIVRLKSAHDDAVPSANTIHLSNLIALAAITGNADYDKRARNLYTAFQADVARGPVGHCGLLAASLDLDTLTQIVIAAPKIDAAQGLWTLLNCTSNPGALEFRVTENGANSSIAALASKLKDLNKTEAYTCIGPVCGLPVSEPNVFKERLLEARKRRRTSTVLGNTV